MKGNQFHHQCFLRTKERCCMENIPGKSDSCSSKSLENIVQKPRESSIPTKITTEWKRIQWNNTALRTSSLIVPLVQGLHTCIYRIMDSVRQGPTSSALVVIHHLKRLYLTSLVTIVRCTEVLQVQGYKRWYKYHRDSQHCAWNSNAIKPNNHRKDLPKSSAELAYSHMECQARI